MEKGPIAAAMGQSRKGQGKGRIVQSIRKFSPETELEITTHDANGEFTRAELARRYGAGNSTIADIVDRNTSSKKGSLRPRNKYFILLDKEERRQLEEIAADEKFSDARRQRATVLLLADIGPHGPGLTLSDIQENTGINSGYTSQLTARAMEQGPIAAAIGITSKGRPKGILGNRKLSPKTELEITDYDASGEFTQTELAHRYGISQGTVSKIVDRNAPSR